MPTRSKTVLVDSSVAVAALLGDHEFHEDAHEALAGTSAGLAGHAWFEAYSVLTRLPARQRYRAPDIAEALSQSFPETRWLTHRATAALTERLPALGIAGGAVYDALVAATAQAERLPLLTCDVRALGTYQAIGAEALVVIRRPA